jgi:hypothetical protein
MSLYIIDNEGLPRIEKNVRTWGRWMSNNKDNNLVSKNDIDGTTISTLFTGICMCDDNPSCWETVIRGGKYDNMQARHLSRKDALAYHMNLIDLIRKRDL